MRHKNSLELYQYWTSKCAGRPAPSRTDIEPGDIRTLLPHIFICELVDEDQLTFRLAGTGLCSLYGRELKSCRFGEMWLDSGMRNANRTGVAVASGATPAVLSLDALSHSGRVLHAEMLLLPVLGPTGAHDRLIGLTSVFEPPYWIGHDPLAGFSTTGIRFLEQTKQSLFLGNRPEINLPRPGGDVPRAPAMPAKRKIGHLTVLDGGRTD
ncbi:PAS domain-containing protein [Hoeflea sp.]|uniref:PAS domain-containing protein n=1 Tax=Hoeflea sp. TaxID=1940281 RepID=UPI0037488ECE